MLSCAVCAAIATAPEYAMPRIDPRIVADLKRETPAQRGPLVVPAWRAQPRPDRSRSPAQRSRRRLTHGLRHRQAIFYRPHRDRRHALDLGRRAGPPGRRISRSQGQDRLRHAERRRADPGAADRGSRARQAGPAGRQHHPLRRDDDPLHDSLVERLGGEVIGIATLWNLAEPEIAGHAVFGLLNTDYEVYRDGDCPLCAAGSTPEPAPY